MALRRRNRPRKEKALSKGRYAKFLPQAPVVIVALGDKEASADWYAVDVSFAVENMVLTAEAEGLGTCCVGSFDEAEVRQTVKAPDNWEAVVMLTVGYAKRIDVASALMHAVRQRKSLGEVASQEEFSKKYEPQKKAKPASSAFRLKPSWKPEHRST